MKTEKRSGQVHRFGDNVALYIGDGSTCYIAPHVARAIARALNACANDIARRCASAAEFRTHEFTLTRTEDAPRRMPARVKAEHARRAAARAERAAKGGA